MMGTPSSNPIANSKMPSQGRLSSNAATFADRAEKARIEERPATRPGVVLDTRSRIIFYLMSGLLHALSLIPDAILYPIGVIGGLIGYWLDRRHVRIGMKNLSIAFPERSEAERARILRDSYVNLGKGGAEYIRLAGFFHTRLRDCVAYDRYSYWKEVAAEHPGKGIIVLSAHFGNFELFACAHAMH